MMRAQKIHFRNARGIRLAGELDVPADGAPVAWALFAHCFTCNKNYKFIRHICRTLAAQGVAVLRFDFTGLGESGGDFASSNFTSNIEDILAAARCLEERYAAPALLIGHSLGGTAMLAAAPRLATVQAVATINAPFEPGHILDHLGDERERIEREGEAQVSIGGQRYRLTRQLLEDLRAYRMRETIRELKAALLILHSPHDGTVPIAHAGLIFEAAHHSKSFVALDRADHLLSREDDARYAGQVIAAWAARYVGLAASPAEDSPAGDSPGSHGCVTVRTGARGYVSEIDAGGHRLLADEPESAGGTDQGASPYELLAAALGACTGITLRMYADHKHWPLERITVRLRHEKIHASDCRDCPEARQKIDRIEREIELCGALTTEQRARLMEIADRCPVHRTLQDRVIVETRQKPCE